jgi:hypothetical protein
VSVVLNLPHGHIWTFDEVDRFVDSVLKDGAPLPRLGPMQTQGDQITVAVDSRTPLKKAALNYTFDTGEWQKRHWETVPAQVDGHTITAHMPDHHPVAWFVSATDESGLRVSTEHDQ